MKCVGCGALNLDMIYELQSSDFSSILGIELKPGHEISLSHEKFAPILDRLSKHGRLIAQSGGGSAANTICVLASLGHETAFLGVAGADSAGDAVIASMKGVDTSLVQRLGENQVCLVLLSAESRDRGLCVFSASHPLSQVPANWLTVLHDTQCLHLSSFSIPNQISLQEELAGHLNPYQILSLDPGEIYASLGKEALARLLSRTNLLFITEYEIGLITGKDMTAGVWDLLDMLCSTTPSFGVFEETRGPLLVVKRGKLGATAFWSGGRSLHMPCQEVKKIVDTTGAGDAFNAGFLHAVFKGGSVASCLQEGHRLAALSLSDFGRNWLSIL